jgi:adenine-specific DNA-methyltransferase
VDLGSDERLQIIEGQLGAPTHRGDGFLIYCGDCVELMSRIREPVFALTITSPPYNIGKEYETVQEIEEYLDWCQRWIGLIHDATTQCGAFWLNLGYVALDDRAKAIPIPYLLWKRVPFFLLQEVVGHYGAGVAARKTFSPRNEKFLWYVKNASDYLFNLDDIRDPNVKYPNQKKNGKLKCNPLGKNPGDVWGFPKVTSGRDRSSKERTAHPAQFPIAVIDRIIKASSQPGDIICDPFLGSGTVIEAALRNGRVAVGIEIKERYAQLAARRLARFQESQRALF